MFYEKAVLKKIPKTDWKTTLPKFFFDRIAGRTAGIVNNLDLKSI